jgi:hypothetical protein
VGHTTPTALVGLVDLKVPDYFFQDDYDNRHTVPVIGSLVNDGNGQAIGAGARDRARCSAGRRWRADRYVQPGESITISA